MATAATAFTDVDLSRKTYRVVPTGTKEEFTIDVRYTKLKYIGGGAYGCVASAEDSVTGRKVAIKKIGDVFRDLGDAKRILRELKLLRHLGGHENISWILDIMVAPPVRSAFRDVYIVTDCMETDLGRIIESPQRLTDSHIKYFTYQILRGLKYLHSAKIYHRDLKPQNILVNSNCELAVGDLGLARAMLVTPPPAAAATSSGSAGTGGDGTDGGGVPAGGEAALPDDDAGGASMDGPIGSGGAPLTVYVVTRWYRAPELLLQSPAYDAAVDMWSVGCIVAEMINRRPLFQGRNHLHQLQLILETLGSPSAAEMGWMKGMDAAQRVLTSFGPKRRVALARLFPATTNPLALDLIDKLLQFDPTKRITVTQALAHPYLADYACATDEPVSRPVDPVAFAFDKKERITKTELMALMLHEMSAFRPGAGLAGGRPQSTRLAGYARATLAEGRVVDGATGGAGAAAAVAPPAAAALAPMPAAAALPVAVAAAPTAPLPVAAAAAAPVASGLGGGAGLTYQVSKTIVQAVAAAAASGGAAGTAAAAAARPAPAIPAAGAAVVGGSRPAVLPAGSAAAVPAVRPVAAAPTAGSAAPGTLGGVSQAVTTLPPASGAVVAPPAEPTSALLTVLLQEMRSLRNDILTTVDKKLQHIEDHLIAPTNSRITRLEAAVVALQKQITPPAGAAAAGAR